MHLERLPIASPKPPPQPPYYPTPPRQWASLVNPYSFDGMIAALLYSCPTAYTNVCANIKNLRVRTEIEMFTILPRAILSGTSPSKTFLGGDRRIYLIGTEEKKSNSQHKLYPLYGNHNIVGSHIKSNQNQEVSNNPVPQLT